MCGMRAFLHDRFIKNKVQTKIIEEARNASSEPKRIALGFVREKSIYLLMFQCIFAYKYLFALIGFSVLCALVDHPIPFFLFVERFRHPLAIPGKLLRRTLRSSAADAIAQKHRLI